jgi:carbon-monoxide dehydrogenase iron sulfur subunit
MKKKVFRAIPDLCMGCRVCEIVCSLAKTGIINPALARLSVNNTSGNVVICRHCKHPLCKEACPVAEAMIIDDRTGAVVIDEASCIGCLACVDACPFGALRLGPDMELLKCDLCSGDPQCVKYCPPRPENHFPHAQYPRTSCLEYVDPLKITRKKLSEVKNG